MRNGVEYFIAIQVQIRVRHAILFARRTRGARIVKLINECRDRVSSE